MVWKIRSEGFQSKGNGKEDGPCYETVRNWLKGHAGSLHSAQGLCRVVNEEGNLKVTLEPRHLSDATTEAEFVLLLGGSTMEHYLIDAGLWADQHFPGPDFCADPRIAVPVVEKSFSGLYKGTRIGGVNGSRRLRTEIRLAIGWAAPISSKRSERRQHLHCQLSVQSLTGDGRRFAYRGAFSDGMPVRVYAFHQDDAADADMIMMMMQRGDVRSRTKIVGKMLTATERPHNDPVTFDVELQWIETLQSLVQMEAFLAGKT